MRRRFVLCLAVFLSLALATFVSLWFARRPVHRINYDNAQKIKKGMAIEEVEAVLGVPPGDYSTRRVWYLPRPSSSFDWVPERPDKIWASNEAEVQIYFDDHRCVDRAYTALGIPEESWWDKICRWALPE
jgi:hypothetical protein